MVRATGLGAGIMGYYSATGVFSSITGVYIEVIVQCTAVSSSSIVCLWFSLL